MRTFVVVVIVRVVCLIPVVVTVVTFAGQVGNGILESSGSDEEVELAGGKGMGVWVVCLVVEVADL